MKARKKGERRKERGEWRNNISSLLSPLSSQIGGDPQIRLIYIDFSNPPDDEYLN
jgi:hypothetical protein